MTDLFEVGQGVQGARESCSEGRLGRLIRAMSGVICLWNSDDIDKQARVLTDKSHGYGEKRVYIAR